MSKSWIVCLIPTLLATLAVATAPFTLSGKFAATAGVTAVYLLVAWGFSEGPR
jgi:hypothetical protein